MFLQQIDLTTALRPSLLPEEILLFVQDAVGLYEGKFKLPEYQNGHAYLTSHRACYVDNEEPRKKAVAVNLKDVDRCELYAGFLKSSAKITLYPKAAKQFSSSQRTSLGTTTGETTTDSGISRRSFSSPTPKIPTSATWICPICSFSNPVPSNFDPSAANENTPIPPCLACGIKPPFILVVKAAIASLSNRPAEVAGSATATSTSTTDPAESHRCPRCTFKNHPSLLSCEMCGASLTTNPTHRALAPPGRVDSPGPSRSPGTMPSDPNESIKFSFRVGGDKVFHEKLKGALIQRKWLLQSAPPAPRTSTSTATTADTPPRRHIGIAGLERRDQELRKNNELIIGNAFEDLSALMASAKEIVALAETFAKQTRTSTSTSFDSNTDLTSSSPTNSPLPSDPTALLSQLNLITTRDMLGTSATSSVLYHSELARQLAEFLTDDTRGILRSSGGIISLVDLWALFNRARGGVELVSPSDFADATEQFERLKLPVRLRRFKSGVAVVQGRERTDEKTIKALLDWLERLQAIPPEEGDAAQSVLWDWQMWGYGVTALEAAERFGWSVGVASEELEMAEERGALCREEGVEGVKWWVNRLVIK